MEKMYILIAFLFPAFIPEYNHIAVPQRQEVVLSTTSCSITNLTIDNVSGCQDNGTADPFDDFFTADILVEFVDPPATGQLRVELGEDAMSGGGLLSIDVGDIADPGSHTFEAIRVKADGDTTEIPVSFSAAPSCRETITNGPAVSNCSGSLPCEITGVTIDNISVCNNNGTADASDDFFTARVSVSFFNPPATGDLRIEPGGDALPGGGATSVPVGSLNEFGHSFNGVRFNADGTVTVAEVEFTADNGSCVRTATSGAVNSCCDLTIANITATAESCPNASDGSIAITATTSTGPLTYAISGSVNQSNGTGVFTGLPDGTYAITVTDNGASNCTESASALVGAGADQIPPVTVCRNTTVTLDATGNYTLTTDDVLDIGASSDNCGIVNITGKFPETISCVQVGQTIPVNVTVNDGNGNAATCTAQITVQEGSALPAGFSGENIGNANGTNAFQPCTGQKIILTSTGFSTSSSDVHRFVSRQLCGNGEIIAHVVSAGGGGWAGITLRETTASGSKKVALKTQFSNNIRREIRTATNGAVSNLNFFRPQDTWLRLVRNGGNFSGYTAMDGVNWNFAFSATVGMAGCIRVGLFSESINTNIVTTAVFDQVVITGTAVPLVAPGIGSVVVFEAPDFQAYPNPTTGELTLDLSAFANHLVRLEISNVHGQTLNVLKLNPADGHTERLDLSQFQAGIYLIAAKSEGWPAVVKRVVFMDKK